jgi:hypothetical protein
VERTIAKGVEALTGVIIVQIFEAGGKRLNSERIMALLNNNLFVVSR